MDKVEERQYFEEMIKILKDIRREMKGVSFVVPKKRDKRDKRPR